MLVTSKNVAFFIIFSMVSGLLVQPQILWKLCLGLAFFLLYINDLLDNVYNIFIYANDTTLCSKCDKTSNLWQQPELVSELESDVRALKLSLLLKYLQENRSLNSFYEVSFFWVALSLQINYMEYCFAKILRTPILKIICF